jgi:anti-sigma factor RsiW
MDCRTARQLFSDAQHGRLTPDDLADRQAHLQGCKACRDTERAELALSSVLRTHLPAHAASSALKTDLAEKWLHAPGRSKVSSRLKLALVPVAAVACAALVFVAGFSTGKRHRDGGSILAMEAVNDHLRTLEGETSLQVMASDLHQVKPWFAGKLDFAPPVAFKGDGDFPLLGGRVARFLEQRAACFVFARRLHKISLFVVPTRGLSSSALAGITLPARPADVRASRGFSVMAWRGGEFAYFLVSDLNPAELGDLAGRMQSAGR